MKQIWITAVGLAAAVFLSACGGTPTATAVTVLPNDTELGTLVAVALTASAQPVTPTSDARPTLPATWTPTFTATAAPPTATMTPTPTPTITPTLSEGDICERFSVTTNLIGAAPSLKFLGGRDQITLYTTAAAPDATIYFQAVHHWTGESRQASLPGGQANILTLPVRILPGTGQYDWTLAVRTADGDEICGRTGSFVATRPESTRAEEDDIR
jgi:hypothetical protein